MGGLTSRSTVRGQQGSLDAKVLSLGGFFSCFAWGSPSIPKPLFKLPLGREGAEPRSSSGSFSAPKSLGSRPLPLASLFHPSGGSKAWGRSLSGVGPGGGSCPAILQPHNPGFQPFSNRRGHLAASTRQVCTPNLGKELLNPTVMASRFTTQSPSQPFVPSPELSVPLKPGAFLPCRYAP